MQTFASADQLTQLLQNNQAASVSLVLPTYTTGREVEQNAIRFKNLLNKAVDHIVAHGASEADAKERLQPLFDLLDDDHFWQHQSHGLAVYLADGEPTMVKLHQSPEQLAYVNNHFYVRPMAVDLANQHEFTALTLTWEDAHLYRATRDTFEPVQTNHFPVGLRDVVLPPDPEDQLQSRTQQGGNAGAMFHGQGEGEGVIESDRRHFLSEIGKRIIDIFGVQYDRLIVAATDEVIGHLDAATDLQIAHTISGSPDGVDQQTLREQVLALINSLDDPQAELGESLGTGLANGNASKDMTEIIKAAATGRVHQLMVHGTKHVWGCWDQSSMSVDISNDESKTELVNLAILLTLQSSGEVIPCDEKLLDDSAVAAIYRY